MKYLSRRVFAALLAFVCTVTPALASQALGWELERSVTTVGPGVTVTTQTFWGDSKSDYRAEQFVTYTPGQGASPVVAYGAEVPSKATLTAMAKTLESGGSRVLAGANGDYFVVATGVPLGMVVTGGVLRSSSSYHYAVGFDGDGNAIIGKPQMTLWADLGGQRLSAMGGYNKTRGAGDGLTLFSRDFGTATKGGGEGINVTLRPVTVPEGYASPAYEPPEYHLPTLPGVTDPETYAAALAASEEEYNAALAAYEAEYNAALAASAATLPTAPAQLTIGGEKVICVVTGVSNQGGGVTIPEGCFVLTAGKESGESFQTSLSALRVGEQVSLSVTCPDPRWNNVQQAIGGFQLLLKDGVVQDGLDNTANPRTALGVKANGQVLLYTMDGRKSGHSVGASMKQVAARLLELGCVDAVLFDGGGSTTFGMTGAVDNAFTLQNTPSDGAQRAVTNALFFVSDLKSTGELGSLYITPKSGLFLPGGKADLTAQGVDTGYYPMTGGVEGVTYSVSGPGTVSGRTFTAGATAEKTEAVVTGATLGGQQGSTVLTVVPTPHVITVKNEATGQTVTGLNLDPDQTVNLTAAATWYGLSLTATDDCFTWAVSGGVGTVNSAGALTAGSKAASGALTVNAGSKTVSIPVSVAGHITPMEDFEGGECQFRATSGAAARLTETQVKYGYQAMEVVCREPTALLETYMGLTAGETDLSFWLYPEDEANVEVLFRLTDGTETSVPTGAVTPGRWNFVQARLPENTDGVCGLRITSQGNTVVYVDQFSSTNGGLRDETPPTVELRWANGVVTAKLSDNVDKTFDPARLELTLDGESLPFTLSGNTVTASVNPADGLLHRISLTVADASGNLKRASAQIEPTAAISPFADTQGHWAAAYADYLYTQGVTQGSPSGDRLLYQPGDNITRGDFVTMLCRWMGLDLSQYAHVKLPFADTSAIQPWAVDAVKAAYDLDIFTGVSAGDALYAQADQTITRAQAMTLLGRTLPKGYATSAEPFLDQADIPAWAAEYVSTLTAQGVVSGYEGYVRPQDPITRAEVAKILTTMW